MRITAHRDRQIVAAVLALVPHAGGDPPHRRVVEQQRFDRRLDQVDEVVVPAHVGQLVREQGLELQRGEPRQGARREQDHRTHPPEHRGHPHHRRLDQADRPADAQTRSEAA